MNSNRSHFLRISKPWPVINQAVQHSILNWNCLCRVINYHILNLLYGIVFYLLSLDNVFLILKFRQFAWIFDEEKLHNDLIWNPKGFLWQQMLQSQGWLRICQIEKSGRILSGDILPSLALVRRGQLTDRGLALIAWLLSLCGTALVGLHSKPATALFARQPSIIKSSRLIQMYCVTWDRYSAFLAPLIRTWSGPDKRSISHKTKRPFPGPKD